LEEPLAPTAFRREGYICPRGVAIGDVHHDPDRLRTPLRRAADGSFAPIDWDEAFDLVEQRLHAVRAEQFTGSQIGLLRLAVSSAGNTRQEQPPSIGSSY